MLIVPASLRAKSVFINDGSIIEGLIENRGIESIILRRKNHLKVEIPNSIILRVISDESYKLKMSIKLKSGDAISGHIVERTDNHAVIRKILTDMNETTIPMSDIAEITPFSEPATIADAPREKQGTSTRRIDPKRAARLSALPIYSGSFLTEPSWPGYAFVAVKTCAFILPFTVLASNFMSNSAPGSSSDSGSSGDSDILKNNDELRTATYVSAVIWILATVGDMYYSYRHVESFNSRIPSAASGNVEFHMHQVRTPQCSVDDRTARYETITMLFASFRF